MLYWRKSSDDGPKGSKVSRSRGDLSLGDLLEVTTTGPRKYWLYYKGFARCLDVRVEDYLSDVRRILLILYHVYLTVTRPWFDTIHYAYLTPSLYLYIVYKRLKLKNGMQLTLDCNVQVIGGGGHVPCLLR